MDRGEELLLREIIKRLDALKENDPIFIMSPAATITNGDITNWNTAYSWGDHTLVGYLTIETDPIFTASPSASITLDEQQALANSPTAATGLNPYVTLIDLNAVSSGLVDSVNSGANIDVDNTDSQNPIVNVVNDPTFSGIATFNAGIFVDGNIGVTGTVDGRDIFTDGLKLDSITSIGSGDIITVAERALLNSALQSGDNVSELVNDAGYITSFTDELVKLTVTDTTPNYLLSKLNFSFPDFVTGFNNPGGNESLSITRGIREFSVNLNNGEASVTRIVAGGRTTYSILHGLSTLDVLVQVYRQSDGRTITPRVERISTSTIEVSFGGTSTNNLFRVIVKK